MKYSVCDLVDAAVDRERSVGSSNPLAEYFRSKAAALERAFGVQLAEDDAEKGRRRVRYVLLAIIRHLASLRSPFGGFLEGRIDVLDFESHRSRIERDVEALRQSCTAAATSIVLQLYPELSGQERTSADLLSVGFDDSVPIDRDDFF